MVNDSFEMARDVIDLLFENFDDEMLKRRIDREYMKYAVKNTLGMVIDAFSISNILNDKGDGARDDFEPYNYVEEALEPMPPKKDNLGRNLILNKPD